MAVAPNLVGGVGAERRSTSRRRAALPWSRGEPTAPGDACSLLDRPVKEVARALLGCRLISSVGGECAVGVIVETEAYAGPGDPASHAATVSGVTTRNRVMFGPPGRAYVYRSYGVHWCMNVVSGCDGQASAVLIRGIEAISGVEVMRRRRNERLPLGAGPGRLCEALGITADLYGHDLRRAPLVLAAGWHVEDELVGVSGRIGISVAADWPHRFYVRDSLGVSRPAGRRGPWSGGRG